MEQGVGEIKGVGGHVGLIWRFRLVTIWLVLTSLFMGGCLYLLYRSDSLVMFRWCQSLGVYDFIVSLRPQAHYDNWLVYSLPDGLWMLAYVLLMGAIWNFNVKKSLLASLPLAVVAIGSELLQIPRWIPGTFDIVDLFCYLMAIWLGYKYICFINRLI